MIHIQKIHGQYWFLNSPASQEGFTSKFVGPYPENELKLVLKARFNITDKALADALKQVDESGDAELNIL